MQSGTLLARPPPKPFRNGVTTSIVWSSHGYAEVGVITRWLFRIPVQGSCSIVDLNGTSLRKLPTAPNSCRHKRKRQFMAVSTK